LVAVKDSQCKTGFSGWNADIRDDFRARKGLLPEPSKRQELAVIRVAGRKI
jgi:hypothetical protein